MKELIRSFSYENLMETCKKEGWRLPTRKEAKLFSLNNKYSFWISDTPSDENDVETHACVYDPKKKDVEMIANKSFIMKSVVIKIPCTFTDKGVTETSCGHKINYPGIETFEYCPFCGRDAVHTKGL